MKVGFFETDITPYPGVVTAGDYCHRVLDKIHSPLKVRATVLDNGTTRVALAGIDCCFIDAEAVDAIKQDVETRSGISPGNVIVGASHTHAGGAVAGMFPPSVLADAPEMITDLAVNRSSWPTPAYRSWAINQAAAAIVTVDSVKEEALISIGRGTDDSRVFNRRFRMKNGRSCTHPGICNPDIEAPAGPVDPEVGVVGAWRQDGSLIGCVVNYACHGTCGGNANADWIHYLQDGVRKFMGADTGIVFLNGACGDVTQVNNQAPSVDYGDKVSRELGTRIAAETVKVLAGAEPANYGTLNARSKTLRIKRRRLSPENLRRSLEIVAATPPGQISTEFVFAKEKVLYDYVYNMYPEAELNLTAIQIGSAVFLSNPAEFFCQLGLDIKTQSNFDYTFVVSLANGAAGYVPTPESFRASGGGYETILTSYSNLMPEAGDIIVGESVALATGLSPEQLPEVPWKPGSVWDYGARGPELE